ncbi:MAG: amidohydrolase family protein [Gemmatimonadetes bacterium]|nr:amidohydrolase family protein [Gemmatimonadota bacterium]
MRRRTVPVTTALAAGALIASPAMLQAQAYSTLSAQAREVVAVQEPVVALTNVRVLDGTGAPVREGQTVVIENGRIAAVGAAASVRVPAGARVMDLSGHTVVPGMIGLHNHTFYTTRGRSVQLQFSAPRLYLGSGVTTIRTTGGTSPYHEINMKRAIEAGQTPGPRMHLTGPYITGLGGGETMAQVTTPDEARRLVAYWAEEGVTWYKAYTQISRDALKAAIDEAHRRGLKFTGHLCSVSFREAVALGIDNLEHGLFTNSDYAPDKVPDRCPAGMRNSLLEADMGGPDVKRTIDEMVKNNVALTSTLAVYELSFPDRPPLEQRVLDALAPEAREEYLDVRRQISANAAGSTQPELFRRAQRFEKMFADAGGLLAAGVDPTGNGGALPGFGDQRNYELLLEAGFTPPQAIRILTLNGAKVLGVDDRLGSIEQGKIADVVVIRGNPVAAPAEIRQVTIVFKDGVGYDATKLIAAVNGQVGIR